VRWHLEPLDREETARYIQHRLRIAGGPATADIFSPGALRLLYRYSGGVPRLINIAAHRALLAGYTREQRTISPALTRHVISELRADDAGTGGRRRGWVTAAGTAVAALVVGLLGAFFVLRPAAAPDPAALEPVPIATPLATPTEPPVATATAEPEPVATATPVEATATVEMTPEPATPVATVTTEPVAAVADVRPPAATSVAVTDAPAAFWAALQAVDHHTSAITATDGLLAAWNVEPLRPDEQRSSRLDLQAIAGRRGLRYLATSGTLARLAMLNLPAILELSVPTTGQRRFAVLAGIAGQNSILRYGDVGTMLTPTEVDRAWLGDAHVLWRDFESFSPHLVPGSRGVEVERLQKLLGRVGVYSSQPSLTYDTATTEAVARFQRSRRLTPDGIVGPLTKIVLYGELADYQHPRLSGREG
jgi:general secretion pathway protein A